jgi:hypothetical protein
MPQLNQGDVFAAIEQSQAELGIIFGYVGFNDMRHPWLTFANRYPSLSGINDPFVDLANTPHRIAGNQWLWFVSEDDNHGMTEAQLTLTLNAILSWVSVNAITSIVTNGIANTDHGHDTAYNRRSDGQRAQFLVSYATDAEQRNGVTIELVSLNDVFVRQ